MLQFKHCKTPKKPEAWCETRQHPSEESARVSGSISAHADTTSTFSAFCLGSIKQTPYQADPCTDPPPTLLRWPTRRCELLSPRLIEPPDHFYSPHPSLFMTLQFDYSERGVWSGESPGEGSHTNTHQSSYERNVDICCLFYHPVPALICLIIKD